MDEEKKESELLINDLVLLPASFSSTIFDEFFTSILEEDEVISNIALKEEIESMALQIEPSLISIRRRLHEHPELMYQETYTSQFIQKILKDVIGVPFTIGWAKNIHTTNDNKDNCSGGHGIVVDLGTGKPPCVLLRADMDGLPIMEETTSSCCFPSRFQGRMHACGHDAHMAMLIGATAILKQIIMSSANTNIIEGTVRIIFQPAEEGGAGAKRMVEEGVLSNYPPVQHAFGMHVWPTIPSGVIGGRSGSLLSAVDNFEMYICGIGGHAAMPHLTIDPVIAVAAIVMGAQTLVSRRLSPLESGVLSITQIDTTHNATNVIPARVKLGGTMRALSTDALVLLREQFVQFVNQCASSYGCCVENLTFSPDFYPPTINSPTLWDFASKVASQVSMDGKILQVPPTMGGEDFAFFSEKVPSAFFFLGQGSGVDTHYGLHHPQFAVDESILVRGVQLHVNLALRTLKKLSTEWIPDSVGGGDEDGADVAAEGEGSPGDVPGAIQRKTIKIID